MCCVDRLKWQPKADIRRNQKANLPLHSGRAKSPREDLGSARPVLAEGLGLILAMSPILRDQGNLESSQRAAIEPSDLVEVSTRGSRRSGSVRCRRQKAAGLLFRSDRRMALAHRIPPNFRSAFP